MTRTTETPTCRTSTRTESPVEAILNPYVRIGQLSQLAGTLLTNDYDLVQAVKGITPKDQERVVEKIDLAYTTADPQNAKFLASFGKLCSALGRLPASTVLSAGLMRHGDIPVAPGGITDLWRGEYRGNQVAVKAFRTGPRMNLEEAQTVLWRLVPMWTKFHHQNIVPFLGVDMNAEPFQLAIVFDWQENGNIMQYMVSHPEVPRLPLLLQVAKGLQYLHSLGVSHGNLKGTNVLIDDSGNARLTNYGMAPVNTSSSLTVASPTTGNSRWLAPEIIDPPRDVAEVIVESKPADIFAFAMLATEVFTESPPFEELSDPGAAFRILDGGRPELPPNAEDIGLTAQVWGLLEKCWRKDPAQRPTIDEVVTTCERLLGNEPAGTAPDDENHRQPTPDGDDPVGELRPTSPPTETEGQPARSNSRRVRKFLRKFLCGLS